MNMNKSDEKLKNNSQVYSLNRLSNPDIQTVSELTAGGDKNFLKKDINDNDPQI